MPLDEDTWVMETSTYSQVVFTDVRPSFTTDSAVRCRYTVTDGLRTSATDRIAVFKVGWQSTQDYYSFVCVHVDLDQLGSDSLIREVVFKENNLPKDDGEFYQFCYVDSCGHVRGASTPFCFQNPAEPSPDCSWEKNTLVVTTQEQVELQEKEKQNFVKEIESLKESQGILKTELDERLREIFHLKSCLHDLKLKDKLEPPDITEQSLQEKYEKAARKINTLKREKVELQGEVERQFAEELKRKTLLTEVEHKNTELQDRVRLLKVDVQSSRKENEKLQAELEELRKVKENPEKWREEHDVPQTSVDDDAEVQTDALVTQLTEARELLRRQTQKCNDAVKHAETAEQELKEVRKKLAEMNESESERIIQVKELQAEVNQLREAVLNYKMPSVAASSGQLPSLQSPPAPRSTQKQTPPPDHHVYENMNDVTGDASRTENKIRVCPHCWEKFAGITEAELAEHELHHKLCPFCGVLCDHMPQQLYEDHVYSHE